jgi:hypothetical protein
MESTNPCRIHKTPATPHAICNRMRTERQKQAARANGAKSRGPVTSEGKLASSRNATVHGILSGTIVLKGESGERFNALLADLQAELQPQTTVEITLVENMAVARWRQMRIWGIEKANMEHQMRAEAEAADDIASEDTATRCALAFRTLSDESRSLELINRYEARYDRQYLRAHHRFLQLVDRRTPLPPPAPGKAASPVPVGGCNNASPDPQFVPSAGNLPQPRDTVSAKRTREPIKRKGHCPAPPQNTGTRHSGGGASSIKAATRFARVLPKLVPSNRVAAVAGAIILSAFSFIPLSITRPPGRIATSSATMPAGRRHRELAPESVASW